jgi:hypothetical protein
MIDEHFALAIQKRAMIFFSICLHYNHVYIEVIALFCMARGKSDLNCNSCKDFRPVFLDSSAFFRLLSVRTDQSESSIPPVGNQ